MYAMKNEPIPHVQIFSTVALALLMMSLDLTIVATALHTLQQYFDVKVNLIGWVLTAYGLGYIIAVPVVGRLSEYYGCKHIFLASVGVFTFASLLCGLVNNIYLLIAFRIIQAIGAAGFMPSATAIVVDYFGSARDRAVSLFGSAVSIGTIVGPFFGSIIITYWSWRGIFLVNVPIGFIIILFGAQLIPLDKKSKKIEQPFDFKGMMILCVTLLAGMLGANLLGEPEVPIYSLSIWLLLGVGTVAGMLFVYHIHHVEVPFISPHFLFGPGFGVINIENILLGGIPMGLIVLLPLYVNNRYGIDPLLGGALLLMEGLTSVIFSIISLLLLRTTGYRRPIAVGGIVIAAGFLLVALPAPASLEIFTWLVVGVLLIGMGVGIVNPATRNAGLQLAPQNASTLAAIRTMFMQSGTIISISVATAFLAGAENPGEMQALLYLSVIVLILIGLVYMPKVPEHKGVW